MSLLALVVDFGFSHYAKWLETDQNIFSGFAYACLDRTRYVELEKLTEYIAVATVSLGTSVSLRANLKTAVKIVTMFLWTGFHIFMLTQFTFSTQYFRLITNSFSLRC